MAEHGTPNPGVVGSTPAGPAIFQEVTRLMATVKPARTVRRKPNFIKKLKTFFYEVKMELKKVIWPSREEVAKYTGVVLLMIAALAAFITIVDQIVSFLTKKFLGW